MRQKDQYPFKLQHLSLALLENVFQDRLAHAAGFAG